MAATITITLTSTDAAHWIESCKGIRMSPRMKRVAKAYALFVAVMDHVPGLRFLPSDKLKNARESWLMSGNLTDNGKPALVLPDDKAELMKLAMEARDACAAYRAKHHEPHWGLEDAEDFIHQYGLGIKEKRGACAA